MSALSGSERALNLLVLAASLLAIEAESVTEENIDDYLSITETFLPMRRYIPDRSRARSI